MVQRHRRRCVGPVLRMHHGRPGGREAAGGQGPFDRACQYHYRTPLYFAVRENQIEVAAFLLDRGIDPFGLAVNDSLLEVARDRGYGELESLLAERYASLHGASPKGEPIAAAIRDRDLAGVRNLLDVSPNSCMPVMPEAINPYIGQR